MPKFIKAQARFASGQMRRAFGEVGRRSRKAQAALEMLLILGFILMLSSLLFLIMFRTTSNKASDVSLYNSEQFARKLAETADQVYISGPNSTATIEVFMPQRIQNISIGGVSTEPIPVGGTPISTKHEIVLTIDTISGLTDMISMTVGNVTMPEFSDPDFGDYNLNHFTNPILQRINITNNGSDIIIMHA
ncbi:Uncharacterised protein [Candidatus Gugararchaeum adminiculabundum]|nr:Uncharacterised protein [Candidatus Gugararchaeum adminiculabundum]